MKFDVRLPIGLLFGLFSLILIATGLLSGPEISAPSLGINIDLWWGFFLLLFSGAFLLSLRASKGK